MQLSVGVEMTPELGMAATPALVAYATMLALPGAELEQAVARELSENPALAQDEVDTCGGCGLPGSKPCAYCGREAGRFRLTGPRDARSPSLDAGPAASVAWADALLGDLRLALPARHAKIAAVVIASLDNRGYLTEGILELARMAGTDLAQAEHVVATLREIGPAGVGARDLRDCLLIQLDRQTAHGITHPLARAIVAGHLESLARTYASRLGRLLRPGGSRALTGSLDNRPQRHVQVLLGEDRGGRAAWRYGIPLRGPAVSIHRD